MLRYPSQAASLALFCSRAPNIPGAHRGKEETGLVKKAERGREGEREGGSVGGGKAGNNYSALHPFNPSTSQQLRLPIRQVAPVITAIIFSGLSPLQNQPSHHAMTP